MRSSALLLIVLAPTGILSYRVSRDATCGGQKGYTCLGSAWGDCCSKVHAPQWSEVDILLTHVHSTAGVVATWAIAASAVILHLGPVIKSLCPNLPVH
jgi:hypothetical protein